MSEHPSDGDLVAVRRAVYRPLRRGNALEDAVARLVQTIRLGVVAPGESLPPERELAASFGVSRDTVREAIRELADTGYLVPKRGRYGGTFVADPLPQPSDAGPVTASTPGSSNASRTRRDQSGGSRVSASIRASTLPVAASMPRLRACCTPWLGS
jgi:DNA-binding GntR family transcriptional regulator